MLKAFGFIVSLAIIIPAFSQPAGKITSKVSIKNKDLNTGEESLLLGWLNYEINDKKLTYELSFPSQEKWVIKDTSYVIYKNGEIKSKSKAPVKVDQTVFHLALTGALSSYGMTSSQYELQTVDRDPDGKVVSTWTPPQALKKSFGKVMVASRSDELLGVVFFSSQDEVITKQFYEDYVDLNGVKFPQKVTKIVFDRSGQESSIEVTDYSHISL